MHHPTLGHYLFLGKQILVLLLKKVFAFKFVMTSQGNSHQKAPEPLPRIPTSPKPEGVAIKPQTSPRRTNQSAIADSVQSLQGHETRKSRDLKKSNSRFVSKTFT